MTGFLAIFLNLILAEEIEDETVSITANDADTADDQEEWRQIQHRRASGNIGAIGKDDEIGENSDKSLEK